MPLITSDYKPSLFFKHGHLSTIYCGLFRRINGLIQQRERLELVDGDFLDLDWSYSLNKTPKVAIIIHGLEGNAQRAYVAGSAKQFNAHEIDACTINLRSCSGETNRLYRSYSSGSSKDLEAVIHYILETKHYSEIYINGFSLGGNITLKYLGEGNNIPEEVKAAIAISVPCNLHDCALELLKPKNILFAKRFKKHLLEKIKIKQKLFPHKISLEEINNVKTIIDFDEIYTSKTHGYNNALDYYKKCSSGQFLSKIKIPTLLINAKNDSFLGDKCYPVEAAKNNKHFYMEIPTYGGHVGFYGKNNITYTERKTQFFIEEVI